MRICASCFVSKPRTEFCRATKRADGLHSYCKICQQKKHAEWRKKNPGRNSQNAARWAIANKERIAETARKWRAKNPGSNKESTTRWRKKNLDRACKLAADRRARKLRATPVWADSAAISEIYAIAKTLAASTGIKHHVDHIVPLQSKLVSGLHVEFNLHVIPAKKNQQKGNRVWPDMPERNHV